MKCLYFFNYKTIVSVMMSRTLSSRTLSAMCVPVQAPAIIGDVHAGDVPADTVSVAVPVSVTVAFCTPLVEVNHCCAPAFPEASSSPMVAHRLATVPTKAATTTGAAVLAAAPATSIIALLFNS